MAEYSEYKDSGIPWIGRIPSHWDVKPIRSFLSQSKELNADENATLLTLSQYKGVNIRNGNEDSSISASESLIGYNVVHKGQFVMNIMLAWNGSYGVSDYDGVISPAYAIFNFKDSVCKAFYHYLWRTKAYQDAFKSRSKGIVDSRLRLYPQYFLPFYTSIPPIEEQEAIVEYLDKVTSDIDNTIAAKERIIAALEERRKIIITHAVTHGINPDVPMRNSGIDWLEEIPAHWEVKPIKRLAYLTLGKMLDSSNIPSFSIMRPYVCAKDVHFDGVNLSELREMPFTIEEERKFQIKNGDLLVVEGGAAGTCAVVKDVNQCICAQKTLIIARCNENALNQYLAYILYICVKFGVIETICNKSTFLHFTKEKMAALQIPVPPIDEQALIVGTIQSELSPIDSVITQQRKLIDLLRERKNIIINETVTGKVKVI